MLRSPLLHRPAALLPLAVVALLAGCGTLGSWIGIDDHEYKTAPAKPVKLEVPPDLTPQGKDDRYAIPERAGTAAAAPATAAGMAGGAAAAGGANPAAVVPGSNAARIERDGAQRWLAVDSSPEAVYAGVKDFVASSGMSIAVEDAPTGVVETGWIERRAGDPDPSSSPVGRALKSVLRSLQSTDLKDRYRIRVERVDAQHALVFVSHRGLQEVYTSQIKDATTWEPAPPAPELEAEMLQRLLIKLGGVPQAVAVAAPAPVAPAPVAAPAAPLPVAAPPGRLVKGPGGHATALELDAAFEHAWRQVGVALDRGGFTVEDRDRIKGLYFVRYIDPDYEASVKANQSWWAKLFSTDPKITAQQFRIAVSGSGERTRVVVRTQDGSGDAGATGERILNQINEQLR